MADSLDVTFNGNDAAECTRFIRVVRKYARASGKVRDYAWIADQAYDAFDGRALHWYLQQPQNVQEDWALLQTALVTEWPLDGNDAERQTPNVPLPAAATRAPANLAFNSQLLSIKHPMDGKIGRLRVRGGMSRRSDKFLSGRVWTSSSRSNFMNGSLMLTPNKLEAQTVKLKEVKPGVWRLGLVNHPSSRLYIAAYAYNGSYRTFGALVGADATNGKPIKNYQTTPIREGYNSHEFWTDVWQLEDDRFLTLLGPPDAPGGYKVPLIMRPESDPELLWFNWGHTSDDSVWKEVEVEFEPIAA